MTSPETEAADVGTAPSAGQEPPQTPGRFELAVPTGLEPPNSAARGHVAWTTWLPYVLLLGPGVVFSVLVTGWILGAVDVGPVNDIYLHLDQLQVAATLVALVAGFAAAIRRQRDGRAAPWLARVPRWAVPACGVLVTAAGIYPGVSVWRTTVHYTIFQCFMAAAAGLWFMLLCGDSGVHARDPDRANAPGSRWTAAASMGGIALVTPLLCTVIYQEMLKISSQAVVERLNAADALGGTFFPSLGSVRAIAVTVLNSLSNAIVEEMAFAVIVLALAKAGWNRWLIVAAAFVLRAAMHLYYGPPGIGMGAFSAVNAYALIKWRRLWPLIVVHTAFDVLDWVYSAIHGVPQGPWSSLLSIAAGCLALTGLYIGADTLIRRAPRKQSA